MGRSATLEPKQDRGKGLWYVSLPPQLSATGRRRREYFPSFKQADERARSLKDLEQRNLSIVRKAGPSLVEAAVTFDELFQIYGFAGLEDACSKFVRSLEAERTAVLFGAIVDAYRDSHWHDWSSSSRTTWNWLTAHLGDLQDRPLSVLNASFWSGWLKEKERDENWSARTFNDVVQKVSSIWRHAVKQGKVERNPMDGVTRRKIRRSAVPILEIEQARLIMQTAWEHDRDLVPYFAMAMFAGLRPQSELLRLCWEDVNFEERWIRVRFGNKTDMKRFVPIEENLMKWLEPWQEKSGSIIPTNLVKRRRYVVRGKYQAPDRSPPSEWKALVDWTRDIARHSYGSYLEGKYRDRNIVKENMGHTEFATYEQHYRNARTPKQAQQYWTIVPYGAA